MVSKATVGVIKDDGGWRKIENEGKNEGMKSQWKAEQAG
jgi:hypothetical protein